MKIVLDKLAEALLANAYYRADAEKQIRALATPIALHITKLLVAKEQTFSSRQHWASELTAWFLSVERFSRLKKSKMSRRRLLDLLVQEPWHPIDEMWPLSVGAVYNEDRFPQYKPKYEDLMSLYEQLLDQDLTYRGQDKILSIVANFRKRHYNE